MDLPKLYMTLLVLLIRLMLCFSESGFDFVTVRRSFHYVPLAIGAQDILFGSCHRCRRRVDGASEYSLTTDS